MALDKLQAYSVRYAFPSIRGYLRYLIGPVKSTPMISKVPDPSVLPVGGRPGGGVACATAWNRLHPQQLFTTFFVKLRSLGMQYFFLTSAIV